MAYIGSSPTKVVSRQSANIFTYTATANQTAFTGSDANGNTLACTPSDIMVHMNGIKLEESDYTASTTTVTLGSGAAAGDEVTITAFVTFESADHYTKSAADTRYVNTTGDTMTGGLTVNSSDNVNISRGASHGNNYEGGRLTLKNGSGITKQYGLDTYYENFRIFREDSDGTNGAVRFEIDSTGRVLTPSQPAFAVHTVPIGFTTGQVLNWQTEETDIGNNFNMSNNRFVAPVSGFYSFSLICFTDRTTSTGDVYWDVRKNGASFWRHYIGKDGASNVHVQLQGGTQIYLAANDYVDVYFTSSIVNSMPSSGIHNRFSGYLIG